jgi:DNA-directed RNA polymerase subunit RPC12/RpoP
VLYVRDPVALIISKGVMYGAFLVTSSEFFKIFYIICGLELKAFPASQLQNITAIECPLCSAENLHKLLLEMKTQDLVEGNNFHFKILLKLMSTER